MQIICKSNHLPSLWASRIIYLPFGCTKSTMLLEREQRLPHADSFHCNNPNTCLRERQIDPNPTILWHKQLSWWSKSHNHHNGLNHTKHVFQVAESILAIHLFVTFVTSTSPQPYPEKKKTRNLPLTYRESQNLFLPVDLQDGPQLMQKHQATQTDTHDTSKVGTAKIIFCPIQRNHL